MKQFLRRFLCSFLVIISLFTNMNLLVHASEASEDADGIYLCDLPLDIVYEYADVFADNMGYSDYECVSAVKYCRDNEWLGYVVNYENNGVYSGFAVIDFSSEPGHYISEFSFDIQANFTNDEAVALSDDSDIFVTDDGFAPFSYSFIDNSMSRGSVMAGKLWIPKDKIFRTGDELVVNSVIEKGMLPNFDINRDTISREYLFSISNDRYACPVAAAMNVIHYTGMTGGHDDAYIFKWLWNKMEILPTWQYDLTNVDEWPSGYFDKDGVNLYLAQKPLGGGNCIASGCRAKRLKIALVGESSNERQNSWFCNVCGYTKTRCIENSKNGLLPEYFVNNVKQGKPSIFLFVQLCSGPDKPLDSENHAVSVVGYARTEFYFNEDSNSDRGETIYACVADGWNAGVVYYMDVTNVKFATGSESDVVLYTFDIKK